MERCRKPGQWNFCNAIVRKRKAVVCSYHALLCSVPSHLAISLWDQLFCVLLNVETFSAVLSHLLFHTLPQPPPTPSTPELQIYSAHNQFLHQFGWPRFQLQFCDFTFLRVSFSPFLCLACSRLRVSTFPQNFSIRIQPVELLFNILINVCKCVCLQYQKCPNPF